VVVEAENVTKSYRDKTILKDINLLVERGSKIAFVEPKRTREIDFHQSVVMNLNTKISS
jgi:ATP-binding cassette subfamily F protein 3